MKRAGLQMVAQKRALLPHALKHEIWSATNSNGSTEADMLTKLKVEEHYIYWILMELVQVVSVNTICLVLSSERNVLYPYFIA